MQYRQITMGLRVNRPGHPDLVSKRPHTTDANGSFTFTDLDDPTLVEFDEHCVVDVEKLLKNGVIEIIKPKRAKPPKKEDARGETTS